MNKEPCNVIMGLQCDYGTSNVIVGSCNVNIVLWNVIRGSCNVNMAPLNVIMGPWNVIMGP